MIVWAYQPLPELEFKTGFVDVHDITLAKQLIENEEVQDVNIGHINFKHITNVPVFRTSPSVEYETKVMKPKSRKKDEV